MIFIIAIPSLSKSDLAERIFDTHGGTQFNKRTGYYDNKNGFDLQPDGNKVLLRYLVPRKGVEDIQRELLENNIAGFNHYYLITKKVPFFERLYYSL